MSKPSEYGDLRFCPKCGVQGLDRDHYPDGPPSHGVRTRQPKFGVEYGCRICGFGFIICKSRRVISAETYAKHERQRRAPVTFTEKCIGTEIARAYLAAQEEP